MKERSVVGEEERCGRGRRIMKERCGRGRRRGVVGGGGEVW